MWKCDKCSKEDPCMLLMIGGDDPSFCPIDKDNDSEWIYEEELPIAIMLSGLKAAPVQQTTTAS